MLSSIKCDLYGTKSQEQSSQGAPNQHCLDTNCLGSGIVTDMYAVGKTSILLLKNFNTHTKPFLVLVSMLQHAEQKIMCLCVI